VRERERETERQRDREREREGERERERDKERGSRSMFTLMSVIDVTFAHIKLVRASPEGRERVSEGE
jgi:hypothetical protein